MKKSCKTIDSIVEGFDYLSVKDTKDVKIVITFDVEFDEHINYFIMNLYSNSEILGSSKLCSYVYNEEAQCIYPTIQEFCDSIHLEFFRKYDLQGYRDQKINELLK